MVYYYGCVLNFMQVFISGKFLPYEDMKNKALPKLSTFAAIDVLTLVAFFERQFQTTSS